MTAPPQAYPAAKALILLDGTTPRRLQHTEHSRSDGIFDVMEETEEWKVQTPNNPSQTASLIGYAGKEGVAEAHEELGPAKQSEYRERYRLIDAQNTNWYRSEGVCSFYEPVRSC